MRRIAYDELRFDLQFICDLTKAEAAKVVKFLDDNEILDSDTLKEIYPDE